MPTQRTETATARPRAPRRPRGIRAITIPASAGALLALCVCAGAALAGTGSAATGITALDRVPPTRAELHATDRLYQGYAAKAGTGGISNGGPKLRRRALFPRNRVVALYGSAHPGFGALGRRRPGAAKRKIRKQAVPYRRQGDRPVIRAFDLVSTVATRCERRRDKCRYRIAAGTVQRYLDTIRDLNGRLLLDIQPGRSSFADEVDHWRPFLRQPDVGVGLDPEWNVGRRGEPGEDVGSVNAKQLNRVSRILERIADRNDLPDKAMVVHQFRRGSVHHRARVKLRDHVDVTLNFDGIGAPRPKRSGYERLQQPPLFNGFSLFYKLDTNLMSPRQVLRLKPPPDYVMYQ